MSINQHNRLTKYFVSTNMLSFAVKKVYAPSKSISKIIELGISNKCLNSMMALSLIAVSPKYAINMIIIKAIKTNKKAVKNKVMLIVKVVWNYLLGKMDQLIWLLD